MYDEHALADKFNLDEWKKIFPYLKPYKKELSWLMFTCVFTAFFDAFFPLMTKYAINTFIEKKTPFLFSVSKKWSIFAVQNVTITHYCYQIKQ